MMHAHTHLKGGWKFLAKAAIQRKKKEKGKKEKAQTEISGPGTDFAIWHYTSLVVNTKWQF